MERIKDVGLAECAKEYPLKFSGGMKRRAAIARALVLQPRILLMDEPFESLDKQNRDNVQKTMRSVCEKYGISILLVTHSTEDAVAMSDRIILMDEKPGRIKTIIENKAKDASPAVRAEFIEELDKMLDNKDTL